jgi:hypothetical protein
MIRPLGEVLKTIGGYGFHIYDDGGALADKLPDAEAKRRMLKLVGDYEGPARRAEKRLRENQLPVERD